MQMAMERTKAIDIPVHVWKHPVLQVPPKQDTEPDPRCTKHATTRKPDNPAPLQPGVPSTIPHRNNPVILPDAADRPRPTREEEKKIPVLPIHLPTAHFPQ